VIEPFEVGGHLLPKGVEVIMTAYAMQRDPRFWKEPERFWPERWLQPSIAELPKFAYFPFGGGPRICIGNHFAMMELSIVLATLVQQVELRVAPGYQLELDPVVTLRPAEHLRVLVRRRTLRAIAARSRTASVSNAPPWA
jgi:cytochrome P450